MCKDHEVRAKYGRRKDLIKLLREHNDEEKILAIREKPGGTVF